MKSSIFNFDVQTGSDPVKTTDPDPQPCLCRCKDGPLYDTNRHIDDYAVVGLRTLALGIKQLSEASFSLQLLIHSGSAAATSLGFLDPIIKL